MRCSRCAIGKARGDSMHTHDEMHWRKIKSRRAERDSRRMARTHSRGLRELRANCINVKITLSTSIFPCLAANTLPRGAPCPLLSFCRVRNALCRRSRAESSRARIPVSRVDAHRDSQMHSQQPAASRVESQRVAPTSGNLLHRVSVLADES